MDVGPVDVLIVEFPGNKFTGEIVPALQELVEAGIIRVLDLLFVAKDFDGSVASMEVAGLGPDLTPAYADLDVANSGQILDNEDAQKVAAALKPGSSVGMLVVENSWARRFIATLKNADAHVIDYARIPPEDVAAALGKGAV
jgi:hypothetical protein